MRQGDRYMMQWCVHCQRGHGIVMMNTATRRLVVACDRCGRRWSRPEDMLLREASSPPGDGDCVPASLDDLAEGGWGRYLVVSIEADGSVARV